MRKVTLAGREGVYELVCKSTKTSRVRPFSEPIPDAPKPKSGVTPDSFLVPTGEILLDITAQEMMDVVKAFACDHYDIGWDVLEQVTDQQILDIIGSTTDPKSAIRRVEKHFGLVPQKVVVPQTVTVDA